MNHAHSGELMFFIALSALSFAQDTIQEINLSYRSATLPSSWLDGFLSESTSIKTQNFGLEYVRITDRTNWLFYYEFQQNQTRSDFWDDIDDPQDSTDGVYIAPSSLAIHALGFQSSYEFPIQTPTVQTSILLGGGLGIGILTGELHRWYDGSNERAQNNSGCLGIFDAETRADFCEDDPDETELPIPVIPILDVSLGIRVTYEQFSTRLMFGLHNLPYWGIALGYRI